MTEQPAPYRPNPTLKRVEVGFESLIFNSRWLMAPFYLGLAVSLAVLLYKFLEMLWEFILHAPHAKESDIVLGVLSLIDVSLTGNLILIVMFSGYEWRTANRKPIRYSPFAIGSLSRTLRNSFAT